MSTFVKGVAQDLNNLLFIFIVKANTQNIYDIWGFLNTVCMYTSRPTLERRIVYRIATKP